MKVLQTSIADVLIVEPVIYTDERGYFMETFRLDPYAELGIQGPFVQDNLSRSRRGVLRGLHIQYPDAQGKLVQVIDGEVFDVAVDLRRGSPTFGQWIGVTLSSQNHRQLWIPAGFAHGFFVTAEHAIVAYKSTDYYNPRTEFGIRWDDPSIGIEWPLGGVCPELSRKDAEAAFLSAIAPERLPAHEDQR